MHETPLYEMFLMLCFFSLSNIFLAQYFLYVTASQYTKQISITVYTVRCNVHYSYSDGMR